MAQTGAMQYDTIKAWSNRVVMEINGAQTGAMQYDTIKEGVK